MKSIYVVIQESFWANSGTNAIGSFTDKKEAESFASKNEDRTDLKNGSQCFVISRTAFNKKYGCNSQYAERYMIEKSGFLTTPNEFSSESQYFENHCNF